MNIAKAIPTIEGAGVRLRRAKHRDSLGNRGTIGPGAIQWMTAGRGIIHQGPSAMSSGSRSRGAGPSS